MFKTASNAKIKLQHPYQFKLYWLVGVKGGVILTKEEGVFKYNYSSIVFSRLAPFVMAFAIFASTR